ncbi:Myosin-VIIa [Trichinella pseudospiralis]
MGQFWEMEAVWMLSSTEEIKSEPVLLRFEQFLIIFLTTFNYDVGIYLKEKQIIFLLIFYRVERFGSSQTWHNSA